MAVRSWGLASLLAQRWIRATPSVSSRAVSSELCFKRGCSGQSESPGEDIAEAESEVKRIKRHIEQALIEIEIYSAAPAWLPLFPGGSFWIHPTQIAAKKPPKKTASPLLEPVNDTQILAMVMPMGWPTSTAARDALKPGAKAKSGAKSKSGRNAKD